MERLETILIDGSKLTDAGIRRLAVRPSLKEIYLTPATNVTDASLAILGQVRSITTLQLPGCRVTDAGLAHLAGLKLDHLDVSGAGITDAGLAGLLASKQFQTLGLADTSLTSAGLTALPGQRLLRGLGLDRTQVDDAGLARLATLPGLGTSHPWAGPGSPTLACSPWSRPPPG